MKPSIELTQEQLESIVQQAIQMDRNNRSDKSDDKETRIVVDDIHSPFYNTNRLFVAQGKELGKTIEESLINNGFGEKTAWGYTDLPLSVWKVRDPIRKLVLDAYLVDSNNRLPIAYREPAQKLYERLANDWLEQFAITVTEHKRALEKSKTERRKWK